MPFGAGLNTITPMTIEGEKSSGDEAAPKAPFGFSLPPDFIRNLLEDTPEILASSKAFFTSLGGFPSPSCREKYGLIRPEQLLAANKRNSGTNNANWAYGDQIRDERALVSALASKDCIFCSSKLEKPGMGLIERSEVGRLVDLVSSHIFVCPLCGWWRYSYDFRARQSDPGKDRPSLAAETWGAAGSLKNLDLTDQSLPIEEVRKFLLARFENRFSVAPKIFEEVVASVYRDLGYETVVTGKSGDGGIDVVMIGPEGQLIGVQVKRYRETIGVGQIREFTGSLVIKGIREGIFVTTSDFQKGADATAQKSGLCGFPIKLLNAKYFYEALGMAQRRRHDKNNDPLDGILERIVPVKIEAEHGRRKGL